MLAHDHAGNELEMSAAIHGSNTIKTQVLTFAETALDEVWRHLVVVSADVKVLRRLTVCCCRQ